MVIVMRKTATEAEIREVAREIKRKGLDVHLSPGEERTLIGVIGDVRSLDAEQLEALPGVEKVVRILHRFKLASREFKGEPTTVEVAGVPVGGPGVVLVAGPCAVESRECLLNTARAVAEAGAHMLRGGAFKPRTSPYSFQGLGRKGLEYLAEARAAFGLPIVTEALSPNDVELVAEYADVLQIGTRNMQNYALLQEVGRCRKPVLLKRGMMSSVEEWLQAADYILSGGNDRVILCERGIRTFEPYTRNTLDLSSVPVIKKLSHLPIFVDPSHGTGRWELVAPLALAAVAAGADGLLVEVHPSPERALSDGPQSLRPGAFGELVPQLSAVAKAVGRHLEPTGRFTARQGEAANAGRRGGAADDETGGGDRVHYRPGTDRRFAGPGAEIGR